MSTSGSGHLGWWPCTSFRHFLIWFVQSLWLWIHDLFHKQLHDLPTDPALTVSDTSFCNKLSTFWAEFARVASPEQADSHQFYINLLSMECFFGVFLWNFFLRCRHADATHFTNTIVKKTPDCRCLKFDDDFKLCPPSVTTVWKRIVCCFWCVIKVSSLCLFSLAC